MSEQGRDDAPDEMGPHEHLAPVYHPPIVHYGHSHRDHERQPAVDWQWVILGVCAFVLIALIVLSSLGLL